MVFVTDTDCVLREVENEFLCTIQINVILKSSSMDLTVTPMQNNIKTHLTRMKQRQQTYKSCICYESPLTVDNTGLQTQKVIRILA